MKLKIILAVLAAFLLLGAGETEVFHPIEANKECKVTGAPVKLPPPDSGLSALSVDGLIDKLTIVPSEIKKPAREDIFIEGYFSAFDALLRVCVKRGIAIKFHFDETLKTNVIDDLGGSPNWWYAIKNDGGGFEEPAHRMDTLPFKDRMQLRFYRVDAARIKELYGAFKQEVQRLNDNNGKVILEEVTLKSPMQRLTFVDVEVKPHRIRGEMFKPEVITAADVMYSLADTGKLSFDSVWEERIGESEVKGYFFTRFNSEPAKDRAGFFATLVLGNTLRLGKKGFGDYSFNITADSRVLCSPKSLEWRWVNMAYGKDEFEAFSSSGKPKQRKSRKDSGEESYE